jgi:hypothetical protein
MPPMITPHGNAPNFVVTAGYLAVTIANAGSPKFSALLVNAVLVLLHVIYQTHVNHPCVLVVIPIR